MTTKLQSFKSDPTISGYFEVNFEVVLKTIASMTSFATNKKLGNL